MSALCQKLTYERLLLGLFLGGLNTRGCSAAGVFFGRMRDTRSFDAVRKCLPLVHYFHANFWAMGGDDRFPRAAVLIKRGQIEMQKHVLLLTMIAAIFACGTDAARADAPSAQEPRTQQSPTIQPTPGPMLQPQNKTDRALERLQDLAEEEEDVLNILD
jgi:hypothetical protein